MTDPERKVDPSFEDSGKLSPLPDALLEIPLVEAEFDTHTTFGEHATKESGAWGDFGRLLEDPSLDIEEGFEFYLLRGPGRFYRAYETGKPITAGLTISPREDNGFQVDALASSSECSSGVAAAAFHKILTRKFFDEFAGIPPLLRTSRLTADLDKISTVFARASYDYGFVYGTNLVIPMPGIAPFPFEDLDEKGLDIARGKIKENKITGILPYRRAEDDKSIVKEEFYRDGIFVGRLVSTSPLQPTAEQLYEKSVTGYTPRGQEVPLEKTDLELTNLRVHFLKTLAENDEEVARLIAE